ncbi:MAG: hypothetical protein AB1810_05645 [Pseudomonadota bacterium]
MSLNKIKILMSIVVALLVVTVSGCAAGKLERAIHDTRSPVALVFKDGQEIEIIEVATGNRLIRCDEIKDNDPARQHACKSLDTVKILADETIRVVKYESSTCVSFISSSGRRTDYCSPPYPLAVIQSMMR